VPQRSRRPSDRTRRAERERTEEETSGAGKQEQAHRSRDRLDGSEPPLLELARLSPVGKIE
jgi:hypothetical protein